MTNNDSRTDHDHQARTLPTPAERADEDQDALDQAREADPVAALVAEAERAAGAGRTFDAEDQARLADAVAELLDDAHDSLHLLDRLLDAIAAGAPDAQPARKKMGATARHLTEQTELLRRRAAPLLEALTR